MSKIWNPWHGCHKISEGCQNCYMFAFDSRRGVDSNLVRKTKDYNLPIAKNKNGQYKLVGGETVMVCLTADFFIEEADEWRNDVWKMIKWRKDLNFALFTKRVERIKNCLPQDWGDGYENVSINLTCENQRRIEQRLPQFLDIPCKKRVVLISPMIERVDISKFLMSKKISLVCCAGENYENARPLHFEWVEDLASQCKENGVSFEFFDTGENFYKNGKHFHIPHSEGKNQALRAGLNNYID